MKSILIGNEAFAYLVNESRRQRGFDPLPTEVTARRFKRAWLHHGKALIHDDTFGGGDGHKNGHWWGWSLDTMKAMLDEASLPYEDGPEVETSYL